MEFVKGNSISFTDMFNEYEIEIKALRIFFKVGNQVWKSEMTLGGKSSQKGFFVFFNAIFPKGRKWEQVDS